MTKINVLSTLTSSLFQVVSASQSTVCLDTFFWLIRSLVDPTLAAFIVCGPLQFLVLSLMLAYLPVISLRGVVFLVLMAFSSTLFPRFPTLAWSFPSRAHFHFFYFELHSTD